MGQVTARGHAQYASCYEHENTDYYKLEDLDDNILETPEKWIQSTEQICINTSTNEFNIKSVIHP